MVFLQVRIAAHADSADSSDLNVPFCAIALILLMTSLKFDKTASDKQELAESFDFLGV